ncbi:MAG: hypothetical protein ACKV0T_28440 [Planctomycetales bacterium]
MTGHPRTTVPAIRLFDRRADHPMLTLAAVTKLLRTTKPTVIKALDVLSRAGVLKEITGRRRDRVYAYAAYLKILDENTELNDSDRT